MNKPCTVCIDIETAQKLYTYPGRMIQVQKGADFYVEQVCYVVEAVAIGSEEDDVLVTLRKKVI